MPMAYFSFALRSRSPYRNTMAYFHFVHRPLLPTFHLIFAWKRMNQSFWYSFHLKIYAFYCSFANYRTFFIVNKEGPTNHRNTEIPPKHRNTPIFLLWGSDDRSVIFRDAWHNMCLYWELMVGLKHYDRKANMSMRFVVKNVHRKTRKHSPKYMLYVVKTFPIQAFILTQILKW